MEKFRLVQVIDKIDDKIKTLFRIDKSITLFGLHLFWDKRLKETINQFERILPDFDLDSFLNTSSNIYISHSELYFNSKEEAFTWINEKRTSTVILKITEITEVIIFN
jgi:hypothetical protein